MSKETDPPDIAQYVRSSSLSSPSLSHYYPLDYIETKIPDDSPRNFLPKKEFVIKEKKPLQEEPVYTHHILNRLHNPDPEEQEQEEPEGKEIAPKKTKHKRLSDVQIRQFKKFVGNHKELKRFKVARMIMFTLIDVWGKAPFYITKDGTKVKKWGPVGICYDTNDYLARGEANIIPRCSESAVKLALKQLSGLKLIHVVLHPKKNKYSRRSISPTKRALIRMKEYENEA